MSARPGPAAAGPASRYLSTYLDDHLSGATVALHRVRRSARSYAGTAAGSVLAPLVHELDEEREFLRSVARALGEPESRVKTAAAWAAERVGRLKPNGHLLRPSPLSALLEVELLRAGVTAKRSGWETLALVDHPALDPDRLARLVVQADRQVEDLSRLLDRLRPAVVRAS